MESLEQQNAQLQADLQSISADHAKAIELINEIMDDLAEIAGRETQIRTIQSDLDDPATWQSMVDLRQQVSDDLDLIQMRLANSQSKSAELTKSVEENARLAAYATTIANLQQMLKDKELTIAALRKEIDELTNQNEELEHEVETSHTTIKDLQKEGEEKEARVRSQEELIKDLREDVSAAYYFIGTGRDIAEAARRNDLKKTWKTYHAPDNLASGQTPRGFRVTSPELAEIPLGYNLRGAKIVSVHKRYKNLYSISPHGSEWILRLREPLEFWRRSRYLVVEIQR